VLRAAANRRIAADVSVPELNKQQWDYDVVASTGSRCLALLTLLRTLMTAPTITSRNSLTEVCYGVGSKIFSFWQLIALILLRYKRTTVINLY